MELYLLKHNMIYFICNCPKEIIIPTNDFEAYDFFKKFQNLYNKKWIAESQNISCGLQKTEPKQFPVIIRPIKNLQGMGRDAYYADKIPKNMSKDHFWCEILKGDHISVDVFFNKYGIQGIIAFQGFPGKLFTFKYWEYLPKYKLPKTIKVWINTHLKSFKGVFNLEMINNKIIECHLRAGDLNYFQNDELTVALISCHKNEKIILPKLEKIYLIPVFVKKGSYKRLEATHIFESARKVNFNTVLNYCIDSPPKKVANPAGGDRVCNLTVLELTDGLKIRDNIIKEYFSNI